MNGSWGDAGDKGDNDVSGHAHRADRLHGLSGAPDRVTVAEIRAAEQARDLERLNAAAERLNPEMAEVLEFQAPWPEDR